ncbi:hypothetical protein KCP78_21595 [Salmonella enterica subsp. enterica]|nr:hypothetical protein KCP78_21595 [Salmonella enterica subsp. enterica]
MTHPSVPSPEVRTHVISRLSSGNTAVIDQCSSLYRRFACPPSPSAMQNGWCSPAIFD